MSQNDLIQQLAMQQAQGGSMIPSPAPEMQEFSLGGEGLSTREALYQQLKNRQGALTDQRSQAIAELGRPTSMSNSETAAMLLIGLLPSLVGGVVKGKDGLAAGAQAGAIGTQSLSQGIENDAGRRRIQAQQNLQGIDEQINDLQSTASKAQLDEINAQDQFARDANRDATTLQAASIRAGGEMSAAREMAAATKQQTAEAKADRETREAAARAKPVKFGNKIYPASKTVRDQDVSKEFTATLASQDNLKAYLNRMQQLTKASDFAFFKNQFGDNKTELSSLREQALKELARLSEIPGRGGEYQMESVKRQLKDPTTLWNNLTSRTPAESDLFTQFKVLEGIMDKRVDRELKRTGYEAPIEIGQEYKEGNITAWVIGYDAVKDEPILTTNKNKMLDILEGVYGR